jgi:hypothetical protein
MKEVMRLFYAYRNRTLKRYEHDDNYDRLNMHFFNIEGEMREIFLILKNIER